MLNDKKTMMTPDRLDYYSSTNAGSNDFGRDLGKGLKIKFAPMGWRKKD
ncbi:MAG: hypothetical protein V8R16_00920 [Bacilli bacterium]